MVRLTIKPEGGKILTGKKSLQLKDANSAVIYISAKTDYRDTDYIANTANILTRCLRNYWPLEVTNLGALNEPFFGLVKGLVEPGEKTANAYYDSKGWVAFVITNIWRYTSPGEDYSWGSFN